MITPCRWLPTSATGGARLRQNASFHFKKNCIVTPVPLNPIRLNPPPPPNNEQKHIVSHNTAPLLLPFSPSVESPIPLHKCRTIFRFWFLHFETKRPNLPPQSWQVGSRGDSLHFEKTEKQFTSLSSTSAYRGLMQTPLAALESVRKTFPRSVPPSCGGCRHITRQRRAWRRRRSGCLAALHDAIQQCYMLSLNRTPAAVLAAVT